MLLGLGVWEESHGGEGRALASASSYVLRNAQVLESCLFHDYMLSKQGDDICTLLLYAYPMVLLFMVVKIEARHYLGINVSVTTSYTYLEQPHYF